MKETLIDNIKQHHDLSELRQYLFDLTVMAALNSPRKFKQGKYLKRAQSIFAILESIENTK